MLLDRRQPADPLVVGEGLVVGGDKTLDLLDAEVLEHLDAEVPVEQQKGVRICGIAGNDGRFDQPDLADRSGDLLIFPAGFCGRAEHPHWKENLYRQGHAVVFEAVGDDIRAAAILRFHDSGLARSSR